MMMMMMVVVVVVVVMKITWDGLRRFILRLVLNNFVLGYRLVIPKVGRRKMYRVMDRVRIRAIFRIKIGPFTMVNKS